MLISTTSQVTVIILFSLKRPSQKKTDTITVEASSFDGKLRALKNINLPSYDPKVIFYEHHPLEGIRYEHAVGTTFTMQNKKYSYRQNLISFP